MNNLGIAAQCWCDKETSGIEVDARLATAFAKRLDEKDAEIAELNEMLDIAWDAVTEAGYEGFSNKLKTFMEKSDASTILDNYA